MTFQRATAFRIARLIRLLRPGTHIVVGGYDPSLAPDAYEACPDVDFLVRGEGEQTFCELLRALDNDGSFEAIAGLSYRATDGFVRNPDRSIARLALNPPRLPNRGARVLHGLHAARPPGRRRRDLARLHLRLQLLLDHRDARAQLSTLSDRARAGRHRRRARPRRRAIFLVDDNITLDVERFESLCQAIIDSGFNDVDYIVQAMTSPLAEHGATLAPLMRRAGFRYVFLGIENVLEDDLAFLKARAKNARREHGRTVGNATIEAIEHLHRHGLFVVGGLIVGNPDDTRESIEANLAFARRYVDWPYIQHPTPYPGTPMTRISRARPHRR